MQSLTKAHAFWPATTGNFTERNIYLNRRPFRYQCAKVQYCLPLCVPLPERRSSYNACNRKRPKELSNEHHNITLPVDYYQNHFNQVSPTKILDCLLYPIKVFPLPFTSFIFVQYHLVLFRCFLQLQSQIIEHATQQ